MEVNVLEHINTETGEFKDSFREQIPKIAGDEFKDTKLFDQIKNLNNLVKTYAHTQKAFDTKMEGVIKQPADDASDEEKAQFRASLNKMIGAPDKADEYELPTIEGMPENIKLNEDVAKGYREICHRHGVSMEAFRELADFNGKTAINNAAKHQKTIDDKFDVDLAELTKEWPGDSCVANCRIAYNAMNEFMKIRKNEDFLGLLKESKIYDNAGDLAKWREIGVMPSDLRLWHAIGTKMKSPEPGNEGGDKGGEKTTPEKVYDHPTSRRLFNK